MKENAWLTSADPTSMLTFLQNTNERSTRRQNSLRGKATKRKLQLFAVSCCQRIWARIPDAEVMRGYRFLVQCGAEDFSDHVTADCGRSGVDIAERYADGKASEQDLENAREAAHQLTFVSEYHAATPNAGIGQGDTDFGFMAIGSAASALESACDSDADRVEYAASESALASAYLKCGKDDRIPPPDTLEFEYQANLLRDIVGNPSRPVTFDPTWRSDTVVALAEAIYADRAFDRLPILADALEEAGCDHSDVLAHCRGPGPHVRGCWVVDLVLGKS